jgi:hypothetical protein
MTKSAAKRLGFLLLTAMLATCYFLLALTALVGNVFVRSSEAARTTVSIYRNSR